MKKEIVASLAIAGALTGLGTIQAHADDIYRLYNRNTGEHFYTASLAERNHNLEKGWSYEGMAWTSLEKGQAIYRLYNPNVVGGDHYYTQSQYEGEALVAKGWKWDNEAKAVFYSGGKIKVSVAYNPNAQSGSHNYTTSDFEQQSLLSQGWKFGSIAWQAEAIGKPIETGLKFADIAKGDYNSLIGIWKNALGQTYEFRKNNRVLANGKDVTAQMRLGKTTPGTFSWSFSPYAGGYVLYAIQAGVNLSDGYGMDKSDKLRDRLVGTQLSPGYSLSRPLEVFYRMK